MKGINTPGQTKEEALPPFPPQGALYLTLLSPPSLGNGTMVMLPLLSLRWGMNCNESPDLGQTKEPTEL